MWRARSAMMLHSVTRASTHSFTSQLTSLMCEQGSDVDISMQRDSREQTSLSEIQAVWEVRRVTGRHSLQSDKIKPQNLCNVDQNIQESKELDLVFDSMPARKVWT